MRFPAGTGSSGCRNADQPPRADHRRVPHLRYPVVAVLDRLLAMRPDDRFLTASEAAKALEALIPTANRPGRGARESGTPAGSPDLRRRPGTSPDALRSTGRGSRRP